MPTRDPQKLREKAKRYYWKHREREIKRREAYRGTHQEEILAYDRRYREEHLEEIRQRQRDRPKSGPRATQRLFSKKDLFPEYYRQLQRKNWLKHAYGITPEQVAEMLVRQDRKCAICQKDFTEELPPCIDHKKGGAVRALLCNHCNLFIGHADENPGLMRRAADYLEATDVPVLETSSGKTCIHGKPRGWNCWQCGGLAVIP